MKKFLGGFFVAILVIILLIAGGLFYVGIIPGFAKATDLGSTADPNFIINFDKAHGMKNEIPNGVVPDNRQAEFSGQTELNADFTSNDITSLLSSWKARSPKLPIKNVQVRFNSDGTGEISGILEIKTAVNLAKSLGYNDSDIEKGKEYIKYTFGDISFYVKGTGNVTNNLVTLNPSTAKLGNVNLPSDITQKAMPIIEDAIERRLKQVPNLSVKTLDFSNGKLHFEGTIPDTIK